jgi:hypothetical protein
MPCGVAWHRRPPSFWCGAPKKHARAKDLEKSDSQFGLPLTPAVERRFRRIVSLLKRRRPPKAIRRSESGPERSRRSTAAAVDRGGAPGGAARPKQAIPARGRPVARAAPGARAGGDIRPRGAAHDPGASRRSIACLAFFGWRGVTMTPFPWTTTRMWLHRENASACIFSTLPGPRLMTATLYSVGKAKEFPGRKPNECRRKNPGDP